MAYYKTVQIPNDIAKLCMGRKMSDCSQCQFCYIVEPIILQFIDLRGFHYNILIILLCTHSIECSPFAALVAILVNSN